MPTIKVKNKDTGEWKKLPTVKGEKGKDGLTPYIKDGYWYIGDENTGVKATSSGGGESYDDTELRKLIEKKVDKVTGKSLILDSEIQRLSNVTNYDDTAIRKLINDNLKESKEYTDTEIANFDFVKIVSSLPTEGLPNKVYFVPKTESDTDNIFDEYAWINNAWEYFGTKIVEVDLTDVNNNIEQLQKNKADKTEIPSKTSELDNDSGFITEEDIPDSVGDGILTGSVIGWNSDVIPEGYEEVKIGYSTEEQIIGTWIDEKPIYRKVVECGALQNSKDLYVSVAGTNIEKLITMRGFTIIPDVNELTLPFIHKNGTSNISLIYNFADEIVVIGTNVDRSQYTESYVILEYTKTTD